MSSNGFGAVRIAILYIFFNSKGNVVTFSVCFLHGMGSNPAAVRGICKQRSRRLGFLHARGAAV